ncbi:hypothetical protein PRIPAC_70494 [Pristionchus pacificus]|uniref:G protein-coupled receptor n=1 Tax=Pristionchus pacificus TaxID=54126 RepID=A0A2A6C7U0_PRIPA|nr:hypothetical protein PRIPAC_70494 [Pristionchus pacificus]|eukprot:PDM74177.1 G protein-coupled receptor [Pristionchus pacificus]
MANVPPILRYKRLYCTYIPEHSSHMTLKIIDSWNYHGSEWAETYAIHFDFYSCILEMLFIFVIDCITLSKLTKFARKNSEIDDKRKKNERRLLVQVTS